MIEDKHVRKYHREITTDLPDFWKPSDLVKDLEDMKGRLKSMSRWQMNEILKTTDHEKGYITPVHH